MARIYFDSNVFSNLQNSNELKYQILKEKIEEYKRNLQFIFSHAHIRDKKKDLTDKKFEDFKFMETIVGDNHISYHALDKRVSFYLAKPLQVFQDEEPDFDFNSLFKFLDIHEDDDENISLQKENAKQLLTKSFENPTLINKDIADEKTNQLLNKFLPDKKEINVLDMMEKKIEFYHEMMSSTSTYKELRNFIESKKDVLSFPVNDTSYNMVDLFKDNAIQEKFVEYVKNSLHHKDKNNIPYYDFYMQCYSVLDILSFHKDKLTKRNSFMNVFNDGLHSFYARYCDFLVTEDKSLKEKSSILYYQFNVTTEILSVAEFNNRVDEIGRSEAVITFFNKLSHDLLSQTFEMKDDDGYLFGFAIKTNDTYFNFFDQIVILNTEDNEIILFLTKIEFHYLSKPIFRECEMITNQMIELFDVDLNGKEKFDFELEVEEMRNDKWHGRYWEIGDTKINLHINEGSKNFCVQLGPFSRWIFASHFKELFAAQRTERTSE